MPTPIKEHKLLMMPCFLLLLFSLGSGSGNSTKPGPNQESMANCEPKTCREGPNVSFPFWIDGIHPPSCGIRLFRLTCDKVGTGYPVISISEDDYIVHNISYDRRRLELKRKFPPLNNSSCDRFLNRSFTLDNAPYTVSPDSYASLIFLFRCNNTATLTRLMSPGHLLGTEIARWFLLPCQTQKPGTASFVAYSLSRQPPDQDALQATACYPPVIFPVAPFPHPLGDSGRGAFPIGYTQLLDFQITLNWTTINCTKCTDSGGRCGTSYQASFESFCMCPDGNHSISCGDGQSQQSKHSSSKWMIIGSVGGALGVAILTIVAVLCWRHFKPTKRSASLSKLIRSASTESYSMEKDAEALSQTHIFSYKELEEATEGFADMNELGDGGFGTVYKGKLRDGRVVAIKRLYENNFKREGQFLNEVAILNRLRHKNLVSLYGCTSRHSRGLLLVYEYVPNGTVADHLHGPRVVNGALTWHVRMNIALETAGALAYLHAVEPQIIHRDVKTNNILLDENYHVKVADFGLSRLFPPDATHVSTVPQGTPGYLDPEYHQCYQLTDKSDVYSFGVVLAELISSKPAVDITRKRNEINLANMAISKIQNCQLKELVDPLLGYDSDDTVRSMIEQVAELAFRCLQPEKEMRPSMEEILEVLKGITGVAGGTRKEHNHLGGKVDQDRRKLTDDCASLLNGSVQYSPNTVHADWVSRTTTPNASS